MTEHRPLNPQQEEFCQNYVVIPNATKAAIAAGYESGSAHNQGYRLLRNPAVQARIAEIRADIGRRQCLDVGAIAAKLESIYTTALDGTYYNAAVQALALQARIAGLFPGGAGGPAERPNAAARDGAAGATPAPVSAERPAVGDGRTTE